MDSNKIIDLVHQGDRHALARCISLVENNTPESDYLLKHLQINHQVPVIGITGPPGAGKSTLLNAITSQIHRSQKDVKIAVLAVDPTSPFTHGAVLGDRLRMSEHFNNPLVYIRSLANRGTLGGISAKTIEITDVLKSAGFDYIFIETVGVGQSEVEVAALADTTVVVFVPESGDEIQTIKSGIMEIADIFVINKSDRPGADHFEKDLLATLHERKPTEWQVPVVKTIASDTTGIAELTRLIIKHNAIHKSGAANNPLFIYKALKLAEQKIIKRIDSELFESDLKQALSDEHFNLYRFVDHWLNSQGLL